MGLLQTFYVWTHFLQIHKNILSKWLKIQPGKLDIIKIYKLDESSKISLMPGAHFYYYFHPLGLRNLGSLPKFHHGEVNENTDHLAIGIYLG